MIIVGLDLSFNSTGYAIADIDKKQLKLGLITKKDYDHVNKKNKFEGFTDNGLAISNCLVHRLLPYRHGLHDGLLCIIEEVAFGYKQRFNSSVYNLLFLGAIVGSQLKTVLNSDIDFVGPKTHKKAFTGKGNCSKEQSIIRMLDIFPQVWQTTDKLDDLADALSILSTKIPNLHEYQLTLQV